MDVSELLELQEKPGSGKPLIAGWHQWADAGAASSGLPQYLIDYTHARKIGEIRPGSFYLFQVPGTHHLLRPVVKLNEGYRERLERKKNEFFYSGDDERGFYVFLGEEPHQDEALYAEAFLDAVEELGILRVATVAGVYGAVPYGKDRNISCVYSLPSMKEEMARYAVKFSSYEGGATIAMYLADRAEARGIELFRFCAFVPSYDFSQAVIPVQSVAIGEDYKAWYDLMARLDHMLKLGVGLSDLEAKAAALIQEWDDKIAQITEAMPQLKVKDYMKEIDGEFTEMSFVPLSHVWEEELRDILDDF
jgi:proteasome assembly chaperone (PAC2) family protein